MNLGRRIERFRQPEARGPQSTREQVAMNATSRLVPVRFNGSDSFGRAPGVLGSKRIAVFSALVLGILLVMSFGFVSGQAYGVSSPAVNQCNGTDNVGGQAVACTVNVINTL